MNRVEGYVLLNILDFCTWICSFVAQIGIEPSEKHEKLFQLTKYLRIVAFWGLKQKGYMWQSEPIFKQLKYMNSCSFAEIFGFGPDLTSSIEFNVATTDFWVEIVK